VEPIENSGVTRSLLCNRKIHLLDSISQLIRVLALRPCSVLAAIAALCVGLLAFGLYLQHVVGLEPCPMCIVQRYTLVAVAVLAALAAMLCRGRGTQVLASAGLVLVAGFGAFVAARQSFLQWYPPEVASCGRDFYGMIEAFPLQRVIPMLFKGNGDCSAIDWTFLGLTIANWSFLNFSLMAAVALALLVMGRKKA
jgi:disulfide bond formation protein DsbB